MSHEPSRFDQALAPSTPEAAKAFRQSAFQILSSAFGATVDLSDRWGLTLVVEAGRLREVVQFVRGDERFQLDSMLDITAVDYLGYPGHDQARFAVVYVLKSMRDANRRLRLKVWVEEEDPKVPTVSDLYRIANWQERETWDQYGIVFEGHPDLRRLLNHVEFQGHPLRKDYPARKRQWLTANDPLVDPLVARLKANGFQVLEAPQANTPSVEETGILSKPSREQRNNVENRK